MSSITEKELKFLFPETTVEIAGHEFSLKPFSFHETFIVAEKLKNVLGLLQAGMSTEQIAHAVVQSCDGVEEIMAMALDLEVETIRKFDNKNAMKAILKIIEVNSDFFSESVQSELAALNAMMDDKPAKKKR